MVYKISEVSNLETALLYPYRILRTASNTLSELLRYSEPFITQLVNYTTQSGVIEYRVDVELNPNKAPFIEFINADILPECADIYEVETTDKQLIIRTVSILSKPVDIAVYEVYSLQQITDLLSKFKAILDEKSAELDDTDAEVDDIKITGKWVIADGVKVPNLVMIDKDSDGLLFGDSNCILSGAVSSQQLVNPTQRLLESMLKCLTDQLTIKISDKRNRVFEGFYNGLLTVDAATDILVFRNCRAVIQLNKITCGTLIIDNCPFVFFKEDSCKVGTLEIRHSTVTINSDTEIDRIMLSRMSIVNQVQCKLGTLLLLEAGSTYYVPELNDDNTIEHVEIKAIQGQFCVNDKPVYLHHQNVSFRRGQVEDPVPVTELKVDITISGGSDPTGAWTDLPSNGPDDIMLIYEALRATGFTKNAAIGALANIQHESHYITHMIGYNSIYFNGYTVRAKEELLPYMDSATSGQDLYNKIQATSTDGNLTGYGLTQFTSDINIIALYDNHVSSGLQYDRLGVQIPAFKDVLIQIDRWVGVNQQSSPGDAAWYICKYYEVPADPTQPDQRRATAEELVTEYEFWD